MSEQEQGGGGRQRQGVFTDGFNIFDNLTGALRLGFVDNKAFVSISPVFSEMKGKKAEKGNKVYDHNNRAMFVLQIEALPLIAKQMEMLEAGEIIEAIHESETKTFGIHSQGCWDGLDGLSVSVIDKQSGATNLVGMYPREYTVGADAEGNPVKQLLCPEWDLLKAFFNTAAIINVSQVLTHGAKMALGGGGGGGGGPTGPAVQSYTRSRRLGGGSVPTGGQAPAFAPEPRTADTPGDFFDEDFRGEGGEGGDNDA